MGKILFTSLVLAAVVLVGCRSEQPAPVNAGHRPVPSLDTRTGKLSDGYQEFVCAGKTYAVHIYERSTVTENDLAGLNGKPVRITGVFVESKEVRLYTSEGLTTITPPAVLIQTIEPLQGERRTKGF